MHKYFNTNAYCSVESGLRHPLPDLNRPDASVSFTVKSQFTIQVNSRDNNYPTLRIYQHQRAACKNDITGPTPESNPQPLSLLKLRYSINPINQSMI
jgi:hypothetical protein